MIATLDLRGERAPRLSGHHGRLSSQSASVILFFFMVGSAFLPSEPLSVAAASVLGVAFLLSGGRVPRRHLILVAPVVCIALLGFFGAPGNRLYDILRDAWRFLAPAVYLLLGAWAMARIKRIETVLWITVLAGFSVAVVHLTDFVLDPSLLTIRDVRDVRRIAGKGYHLVVIALVILLTVRRYGIRLATVSRPLRIFMLTVLALSFFLSFSRTLWGSLLILLTVTWGAMIRLDRRTGYVVAGGVIVLALASTIQITTSNSLEQKDSFVEKVLISFREIAISDYEDISEIHALWRGYEAYRGVRTYAAGQPPELIVGRGFGTLVDVGLFLQLGDFQMRYVPLLHNGYVYVLVKTGIIGVLLYLAFFGMLFSTGRGFSHHVFGELRLLGRLLVGLAWLFLFTTLVVTGLYNRNDLIGATLIGGALYVYLNSPTARWIRKLDVVASRGGGA